MTEHTHDHEGHEHITLVDEEGNETLYEILLTIDGQEEFGRNYVLLYPAGIPEDEETAETNNVIEGDFSANANTEVAVNE